MTNTTPLPRNAGNLAAADLLHDLMFLEQDGPTPADLLGDVLYPLIVMGRDGNTLAALEYLEGFSSIIAPMLVQGIERASFELSTPDLEARP